MRNKYFYLSVVSAVVAGLIPTIGVFNLGLGEDLLTQTILDQNPQVKIVAETEPIEEVELDFAAGQQIITSQLESLESPGLELNEFMTSSVIVQYEDNYDLFAVQDNIQNVTGLSAEEVGSNMVETKENTMIINLGDKDTALEVIQSVREDESVKNIQPIYTYKPFYAPTNDPKWSNQWYYTDQVSGVGAESGWDNLGAINNTSCSESSAGVQCGGDPNVKIAVIDTGVNVNASDFAGANIDTANSMRFYNNNDNTCAPGTYYVGFQNSTPPPSVINFCQDLGSQFDEQGHGTGVSSMIFAQDNSTGAVGLAHNTTLLPIAVHGDAFNTYFIAEAVSYAADNGADVINLSLGTPFFDSYLESAINDATSRGVVVVAASGNCAVWSSSCDWDGNGSQTAGFFAEENNAVMYPAGFGNVVAVGASNYATTAAGIDRAYYSNFGPHLDVVAPVGDGDNSPTGNQVLCGVVRSGCASVNTYRQGFGTSYASPQVAGAIGLMLSGDNGMSVAEVRSTLKNNTLDIGAAGFDNNFGDGLIKVSNLVNDINIAINIPQNQDLVSLEETELTVEVSASSSSVGINNVRLYNFSNLEGAQTNAPFVFNVFEPKDFGPETLRLTAVATDNNGSTRTSSPVLVHIVEDYLDETFQSITKTGDINGNARADLIWRHKTANEIGYWDGGRRSVGGRLGYQGGAWEYIGKGDINGDSRTDILWKNKNNKEMGAWLSGQQSNGTFLGFQGDVWEFLGVGDLDNNGTDEIIWKHRDNNEVGAWQNGQQRFGKFLGRQSDVWKYIGVGDVNGDSRDDIVWRNDTNGETGYWPQGLPIPGSRLGYQGLVWAPIGVGDFDSDGRVDISWMHRTNYEFHLWRDGLQAQGQFRGRLEEGTRAEMISDINGDGRDDIVVRSGNQPVVWYGGFEGSSAALDTQSSDWILL